MAVAPIVKQPITRARRASIGLSGRHERAALDAIDVNPAVTVVIQQCEAAAERFRQLVLGSLCVVIHESQTGCFGIVGEGKSTAEARRPIRAIGACGYRGTRPRLAL